MRTAHPVEDAQPPPEEPLRQAQAELRQALEAARRAESTFSLTFEFAPIGMALTDPHGAFLRVNKSYCQLLGYAPDELLQRTFADITHPDDLALSVSHREQLLAGEVDSYRLEKRYLTRAGATVWVSLSVSLVRYPDGTPRHTVAHIIDITESRAAAEALRRSER